MEKLDRLRSIISGKNRLLIAFSGGVDSSLLAKVAYDLLGDAALAVTLDTVTLPRSELEAACEIASDIGIPHRVACFSEIEDEEFVRNTPDRCYFCKRKSAKFLKGIASEESIETVAYGVNISDFGEHRPGIKACNEEGIWHPFVEASLTKSDVREISKDLGLPSWDKPSTACLSSRIPYGENITIEKLKMIEDAEEILRSFGFLQSRVRLHGNIARIEVLQDDMEDLISLGLQITTYFKDIGFGYVSMDLKGYRSGSMDEVL